MGPSHRLALPLVLLLAVACKPEERAADSADFAVFSDPHLHDAAALGASGADFEAYLAQDRKMIAGSQEILDATLADLALGQALYGVWTDLPPADNDLSLTVK